jgi:methionyl-tRNA synthetase
MTTHSPNSISGLGNKLLQDSKLSNQLLTEDPARAAALVALGLNHIHLLANLLSPYMPLTAVTILTQLGLPATTRILIPDSWTGNLLTVGHRVGKPSPIFTQIPAAKLDEWRDAYGGEELKRAKEAEALKAQAKKAKKEEERLKKKAKKEAKKTGGDEGAAKSADGGVVASVKETAAAAVESFKETILPIRSK